MNSDDTPREYGESLVIRSRPLLVLPKLAQAIGLLEAIVFNQVLWLFEETESGKLINGERWIFNTYQQWVDTYFPFVTENVMKRCFLSLESMHLLESCQPEGGISRRKYYRINKAGLRRLETGRVQIPAQFANIPHGANLHDGRASSHVHYISETSSKMLSEPKETLTGKPVSRYPLGEGQQVEEEGEVLSQQQLLERRPRSKREPKRDTVDKFIEREELNYIANSDVHERLRANKFCQWNAELHRWEPILHWQLYLKATEAKMLKAASKGKPSTKAQARTGDAVKPAPRKLIDASAFMSAFNPSKPNP